MTNDLISRSALKDDLVDSKEKLWEIYRGITHEVDKQICAGQIGTFQEVILRVKDAPAVDAVEVVRCKDCKWLCSGFGTYSCAKHTGLALIKRDGSSFCSYGERRADDGSNH